MYQVFDSNGNLASTHVSLASANTWVTIMAQCGKTGYTIQPPQGK